MALNPEIFKWTRETAGLSLEQAAKALGFSDTQKRSAAARLAAMEAGEEEPSRSVLLRMSKTYRRSLLVFYLLAPPRIGDRGRDFRTVPGAPPPLYNPVLDTLIRDLRGRQSIVRALVEDDEPPVEFIGNASMKNPTNELARRIVEQLQFSLTEFRQQPDANAAFTYLRGKIEAAGIYVLLLGNLGSHHTNIPAEIFRGFAIADPAAPFIVINDQDARAAWSFTALHETAHLWIAATGVSGSNIETQIERYCNDVAGEILLPASEARTLAARFRGVSINDAASLISTLADKFKVSRPMLAYKLYRVDAINSARWNQLNDVFRDQWLASQAAAEQLGERASAGGPSYYVVRRHRIGNALLDLIRRSLGDGSITYTKAGQVLGVKPRNVYPLLQPQGTQR